MARICLALLCAFSAAALGACAEGKTRQDAGEGGDGDASPGTPDARPPRADAIPGSEICDGMDNDGDTFVDEGDDLCAGAPHATGRCNGLMGCVVESCEDSWYDVDGEFDTGCECMSDMLETGNNDCANAHDLGDVPDSNSSMEIIGNAVPESDEDWYRFRAIDSADTSCDNFHVRVQLLDNPDDQFAFDVWRGGCGTEQVCDTGSDMQWYTNFFAGGIGECPCGPTAANHCDDDTAEYHVRVYRKAGAAPSCANYTLEVSNGKYPAP